MQIKRDYGQLIVVHVDPVVRFAARTRQYTGTHWLGSWLGALEETGIERHFLGLQLIS
jgi:hypothetical protein